MSRKAFILSLVLALALSTATANASGGENHGGPTPDQGMTLLKEGNSRFVAGAMQHDRQTEARRVETAKGGQHPFATVITCSDSRVPPEILFDQGLGDVFVIRVAGNVSGIDEIGSIEYGVGHLGTPVLVVLGHTKCGAVTAAATHAHAGGSIPALLQKIQPAVHSVEMHNPGIGGDELVAESITANVLMVKDDLMKRSLEIRTLVNEGKLRLVGAIYDIESGEVRWLD